MSESLVFRSFYTEEEAINLLEFLKEHGIEGHIVKHRAVNDKIYVGENYYMDHHVKIKAYEFTKADAILDSHISQNLSQIDSDYYLHSFSDDELLEIIEKPDEWNNQDTLIAKKILEDRGHLIGEAEIAEKKRKRLKELEKPEKEDRLLIILGYFFALFFGFFGIFFGLLLMNFKKTLPDGRRVLVYEQKTRSHGKYILIIGLIVTGFIFARIFNKLV